MTIDERLEKLAERHEALSQSVELLTLDIHQLTADVQELSAVVRDGFIQTNHSLTLVVKIIENHESRIEKLEGRQ